MQPKDILSKIISAERSAQEIYDEALRSQEDFDAYLAARSRELRDESYREADRELAEFEARKIEEAEAELLALEGELVKELEHVRTLYEERREGIVEALFNQVVGGND